jgi:hypothetical protein
MLCIIASHHYLKTFSVYILKFDRVCLVSFVGFGATSGLDEVFVTQTSSSD